MFQTQHLRKHLNFHHKHSTQFKDNTLVFRFLIPMSQYNINCAQVWSQLLDDRSVHAPTKQAMIRLMDELYDASFGSYLTTYGQSVVFSAVFKGIEGTFVNDPEQNKQFINWMMMILEGVLVNQKTLKEAKINVLQNIKREQEQHVKYAMSASAARYQDSLYSLKVDGDEGVASLTLKDMDAFKSLLNEVACDVYHVGQIESTMLSEALKQSFLFTHKTSHPTFTLLKSPPLDRLVLKKTSSQTILVKTYSTNIDYADARYLALRVAAIAFGSLPTSLLFSTIREKHSLCYFIHASVIAFDGVMNVITGIDGEKVDTVSAMIDEQFNAMVNIEDGILDQAKQMMIHSLMSSDDDVMSAINLHYASFLKGDQFDINVIVDKIMSLKRSEIIEAIQQSECVGEFVLLGDNHV